MNKLTILLCCLALPYVLGVCETNLISQFTFLVQDTSGTINPTSLNFCTNLQNGTSSDICCSSGSVNNIQSQADLISSSLQTAAGNRDSGILSARASLIDQNSTLTNLQNAFQNATANLNTMVANNVSGAQSVLNFSQSYNQWYTAVITNYNETFNGFNTYQQTRATCFDAMIQSQAATWCLACDGTAASNGYDPATGDITYDPTFDSALNTACFPYLNNSASQSVILTLNAYSPVYSDMLTALGLIIDNNQTGVSQFNSAVGSVTNPPNAPISTQLPPNCNATSCSWLRDDVFVNGILDQNQLVNGGTSVFGSSRLLGEERFLAGTFAPSANEAGVTVSFPTNPGNVNNNVDTGNSAIRTGIFSVIGAIFVSLLF